MPELPEVETVRRGLAPVLEGRVIAQARVNRPDLRFPLPDRMAERLTGARVLALRRGSKYILADLSTAETLLIHLGMSGRMLVSGAMPGDFHHDHPAPQKHDHVVLEIEGGARVTFNDARRFGAMDLMPTDTAEAHPLLAKLGPEPLGNAFDGAFLAAALAGRRTPIKSALLDQHLVAGLGNIYVCEVLYRAGIAPQRLAGDLTAAQAAALVPIIRDVLDEAITNKWKIGHTFGASGMLNLELAIMMIQHNQFVAVPFAETQRERKSINKVLINAVGFGGNAVTILLSKK